MFFTVNQWNLVSQSVIDVYKRQYQMGVWKALNELGIEYQIVTGASVGALNGAMMAQKDLSLIHI